MEKGSCSRGEKNCRFSHKISEEERVDVNFLQAQREVKDERASKCINEFQGKGFCRRKDRCPFSHKITEEDRINDALKKSMEEREVIIKKKREDIPTEKCQESIQTPAEFMKRMMALKNELVQLM